MGWNRLLALAAVGGLSIGLGACDDDDSGTNPPAPTALLRAVHASPDAPAVDVYVEGVGIVAADIAYGEVTSYLTVEAGTYNVQLRPAGAAASTPPVYETGNVSLPAGGILTAVAAGLLGSTGPEDSFRIIPLFEEFDAPATGNAIVRVLHASPDAPAVDIDVGDDGSAEITGLARFADTGAAGIDLPGGTALDLAILAGGTPVTSFTVPAVTAGTEYFVIATGLVSESDISADDSFRLLAVSEGGSAAFVSQNAPAAGSALLRLVHASPDAPAVDVYLEGKVFPAVSGLEYGVTTSYLTVPAGARNIQLRAHPSAVTDPIVYETGALVITADQEITAVAAGFLASGDASDRFRVLPFVEDFGTSTSALVRIVHAGPDAPAVDLDVGDDGSPEVSDLTRFDDTGAAGIALPSGTPLQIGVRIAGGDRVTAFTTPELPDGEELFVIATGSLARPADADDGFSLLAVNREGSIGFIRQNPVLYALHGSPDAPAVDIYAGAARLIENLAFGELSASLQVPPSEYTLDVYGAGTGPGVPVASFGVDLRQGGTYLAVAAGELTPESSEAPFTLLPYYFEAADASGTALVRAIHASGDAPLVDVGTVDAGTGDIATVVIPNLTFGQGSEPYAGTVVPVGALTIGVAPQGEASPVATFDVMTSDGLQGYAIAAGALSPDGDEEAFRLILVAASENPWVAVEVLPNP